MKKARSEQVDLESTPFYHCYVRCVRRAYLRGEDHLTGESYDDRKQWIISRLKFLSYVYAIDICAYAVMSNHKTDAISFEQLQLAGKAEGRTPEVLSCGSSRR